MAKTTDFGYQDVPEHEKSRRVADVFDSVSARYDFMNDLMSLGLHRLWKRFTVAQSLVTPGSRVLDVAGGTADLARLFAQRVGPQGEVVVTDINAAMLGRGRDRLLDAGLTLPAVQCDAERLPFATGHFDCVSVAFGLRNMTHKERGSEARRGQPLFPASGSHCGRSTMPIRSTSCRGSVSWLPTMRRPTVISPSRSACTPTRSV